MCICVYEGILFLSQHSKLNVSKQVSLATLSPNNMVTEVQLTLTLKALRGLGQCG